MKIKFKLIVFILSILIIPVFLINLISSDVVMNMSLEVQLECVERIVRNQADDINAVCESIVLKAKQFTINENVRRYFNVASEQDFEFSEDNEEYIYTVHELNHMKEYDNSIVKAMIVDKSGIVIASTASSDRGRRLSNYKELFSAALENNGFSNIYMSSENSSLSPVFTVSKSIYTDSNERVGILYIIYDTAYIQKYINNIKLDKYTNVALIDGNGGVLEYPYKNLKTYSDNQNYAPFSETIKQIVNSSGDSDGLINNMTECGKGVNTKTYYVTPVSNSGWYLASVTDKHSMDGAASKNSNGLEAFSFVLCIILIVTVCVYVTLFSKPVLDIIKVFTEKQKGNTNAHFDIRSNDEFRQIGVAFNSMFDNIFESEQRYRTIVEMTNNIIFEINYKKGTVFVSKNFNKKFSSRPKDDTLQESFIYKLRIHKDDKERYFSDIDRILGPANFIQGEYRVKSIYGDFIWIMIKATKFFDRDEVPTKIVGLIVDIDREKKSEMHLLQRASYDNLTQLYNRETFLKSLSNEFEISAVKKSLDAVMFIDLDDFKFFNDEYGHACGDEVLKFVADTLKEISFERGFAGRFGGDEFVVCFTGLTLYGDSGKIAQEIIDVLGKGFISDSTCIKLSIKCSIGIAFLRESGKNTEEVIAAADEAMYNIKKHGKSAYAYAKSASAKSECAFPQSIAPSTSAIDSDMNRATILPPSKYSKDNDNFFDQSL